MVCQPPNWINFSESKTQLPDSYVISLTLTTFLLSFLSCTGFRLNIGFNFKILLITYKALHGLAPNYITELITVKPLACYNLRSDGELFLQRPTIKSSATLGDRSFALAAPTLRNELPTEIRHANSILTFKKLLKTFLFKKAFYQFN